MIISCLKIIGIYIIDLMSENIQVTLSLYDYR